MSEQMGIDVPEFQLAPDRREYLRKFGRLVESVDKAGKKTYSTVPFSGILRDEDGTTIYLGIDEVVRRERGMEVIEQTPAWILRAIMQHAKGSFSRRGSAVWPDTVWSVQHGIREVLSMNKIDDEAMPLSLRKSLVNDAAPLISRFLIRLHPEYGTTHFIGIRRRLVKKPKKPKKFDGLDQMDLDMDEWVEVDECDVIDDETSARCLDDYLFPELRGLTANATTAPGA